MRIVGLIAMAIATGVLTVIALGYFRYQSHLSDLAVACPREMSDIEGSAAFCSCMVEEFKSDVGVVRGVMLSSPTIRAMTGAREAELDSYGNKAILQCQVERS